jgi:hypothetical protein
MAKMAMIEIGLHLIFILLIIFVFYCVKEGTKVYKIFENSYGSPGK